MKILVAALMTALLVFALATGWMEYVQPKIDAKSVATAKPAAATTKSTAKRTARRASAQEIEDDGDGDGDVEIAEEPAPRAASRSSRSSSSSKATREKEAATKAAKERLMAQLDEVKQQESKLVAREEMLRMLYEDIRSELSAVEDIRRQSATELALAERRVLEAANTRKVTESASSDPDQPLSNAKKASAEAKIASVVQDMARQGNVAAAASLLSGLKEREVAKILTTLSSRDPRLALQLSDRVQAAKQDTIRR